jgi:hypothetical protein
VFAVGRVLLTLPLQSRTRKRPELSRPDYPPFFATRKARTPQALLTASAESVVRGRGRWGSTSRHWQMTGNRGCTESSRILDCLLTSLPEARARHFREPLALHRPAFVY